VQKTFIGTQLRQLRRDAGQTQAEMARVLGISAAYVNLLEKNQRSLSVPVLMALADHYNVDWRDVVMDKSANILADLRNAIRDPLFAGNQPDIQELRSAIDYAPSLVQNFIKLHQSHRTALDNLMRFGSERMPQELLTSSAESIVHDFFRNNFNYFDVLEKAAANLNKEWQCQPHDVHNILKHRLFERHAIEVITRPVEKMNDSLRIYDAESRKILLSEALDFQNRTFQLAHVLCFVELSDILYDITATGKIDSEGAITRCHVELANYFAAAVLMPYDAFHAMAEKSSYDVDRMASAFAVSFEQVCHRLTTLQRENRRGVPFFFLRIDKAGNVTKRFNATSFNIAEYGGSCPVWNLHTAFRTPGVILPQYVELPEGDKFFTLARTTERPAYSMQTQDRRLAIALGCEIKHAHKLVYTSTFQKPVDEIFSKIGINCHLCLRRNCSQRAHDPLLGELTTDTNKRGETRYES
jgi:predicted transcriptional regulator/DNA-binding XRE family transcriptional regulator